MSPLPPLSMYVLYIPCTRTVQCRGSLLHILKTKKSNGQIQLKQIFFLFLPPATKLGQGYVFTRVCDSVHSRGCLVPGGGGLLPGRVSGAGAAYPGRGACLVRVGVETPHDGYYWGRYASYWNAFLFSLLFYFLFRFCPELVGLNGQVFMDSVNFKMLCEKLNRPPRDLSWCHYHKSANTS